MEKDRETAERDIGNERMQSESWTRKHVERCRVKDKTWRAIEEKGEEDIKKRERIDGKRMHGLKET